MKKVKVGIIGFGTVGAGTAVNLLENHDLIAGRSGVDVELAGIADLDITSDRGVSIPEELLTTDSSALIEKCDIVVELIGGTRAAKDVILRALNAGKSVVTANKALLALHGKELFEVAEKSGADLFFEASVAGGIPIIKALREGLATNRIRKIFGIMNGTCNYILTRMEREGASFDAVLKDAQKLGYAEAEPSLDIDGHDTSHKTAILASLAYGEWFGVENMCVEGIRDISAEDIRYAGELDYRIKLLGIIKEEDGGVQMRVHPTLIPKNALLSGINEVFNGVMVDGDPVGSTLFYGRGAGREATSSAVAADVVEAALNIANGCVRRIKPFVPAGLFEKVVPIEDISSRYYLHMRVEDAPGVVAAVSRILAAENISISSFIQPEERCDGGDVAVVILTHTVKERAIRAAVAEMEMLPSVKTSVKVLRIEDI